MSGSCSLFSFVSSFGLMFKFDRLFTRDWFIFCMFSFFWRNRERSSEVEGYAVKESASLLSVSPRSWSVGVLPTRFDLLEFEFGSSSTKEGPDAKPRPDWERWSAWPFGILNFPSRIYRLTFSRSTPRFMLWFWFSDLVELMPSPIPPTPLNPDARCNYELSLIFSFLLVLIDTLYS